MNNAETIGYVVGFAFSQIDGEAPRKALLVEKKKPDWQRGRLNGVGGKIEAADASPVAAMVREFAEEASVVSQPEEWREFARLTGRGYVVHCFSMIVPKRTLEAAKSPAGGETLIHFSLSDVFTGPILPNLKYLLPLALDTTLASPVEIAYRQ